MKEVEREHSTINMQSAETRTNREKGTSSRISGLVASDIGDQIGIFMAIQKEDERVLQKKLVLIVTIVS